MFLVPVVRGFVVHSGVFDPSFDPIIASASSPESPDTSDDSTDKYVTAEK